MTQLFPECDQLPTERKRAICRGEAGLPLDGPNSTNAYRRLWGLAPLGAQAKYSPPSINPPSVGPQPSLEKALSQPSLIIRGWNFAAAMARWSLAGMPRRSQAEIDERLAICQACPFLQNDHCTKCGCACVEQNRLINKLALTTERCPEGKWS